MDQGLAQLVLGDSMGDLDTAVRNAILYQCQHDMNVQRRLATYIVVTTTKNRNQDEIFMAQACGTGNRMVCIDFDTIEMTRWLLASRRQSWLAKYTRLRRKEQLTSV